MTTSKDSSSKGKFSASASTHSSWTPSRFARSRPASNSSGVRSLAVTCAPVAAAGIEAGQVDEVILSNAMGPGGNPARRVALAAGLPDRVAGLSIDRQCAGGLDALLLARAARRPETV